MSSHVHCCDEVDAVAAWGAGYNAGRFDCTCGHRLSRHHERGCIDCGEPPTGFHAFQRQTDAEYRTREPGLREAAQAYAAHVQAMACDHYVGKPVRRSPHAGTHTGCSEALALRAALASEAPRYTEDDPDWAAMVSPISETDGGQR